MEYLYISSWLLVHLFLFFAFLNWTTKLSTQSSISNLSKYNLNQKSFRLSQILLHQYRKVCHNKHKDVQQFVNHQPEYLQVQQKQPRQNKVTREKSFEIWNIIIMINQSSKSTNEKHNSSWSHKSLHNKQNLRNLRIKNSVKYN